MLAAPEHRDMYEDFEPCTDTFYFKIGNRGKISFHGPNYHITKQLTPEQRASLIRNAAFVRITSNCYVNVNKISSLEKDHIRFIEHSTGTKIISVPMWKKTTIQQRLSQTKASGLH
ncbi:hypothetical protein [Gorillibacterium sp. sgz5001074]|uniref:hypothetical protein n=1 Tax=Gorillibacterium sp. sgz5001074 TaxID=3446695 RepID=UPI003F66584D